MAQRQTSRTPKRASGSAVALKRPDSRAKVNARLQLQEPFLLSIKGAMAYLDMSDSKIHELIDTGDLRTMAIGRRVYIPTAVVRVYVQREMRRQGLEEYAEAV